MLEDIDGQTILKSAPIIDFGASTLNKIINRNMKRSDYFFLAAALIALVISVYLWFSGDKDGGLFIAIWVPSLMAFGIYLKFIYREV